MVLRLLMQPWLAVDEKGPVRPPWQAVCLTAVLSCSFVQHWAGVFLPFVPLCPSFHNLPLPV